MTTPKKKLLRLGPDATTSSPAEPPCGPCGAPRSNPTGKRGQSPKDGVAPPPGGTLEGWIA